MSDSDSDEDPFSAFKSADDAKIDKMAELEAKKEHSVKERCLY